MDPTTTFCPNRACPARGPKRPGEYPPPFAHRAAVYLQAVPQNFHRHARHRLLPAADFGCTGGARGDVARAWLPIASSRRCLQARRADSGGLVGTRRPAGSGRPGVSDRATPRPGARASRRNPREATGWHRVDGPGDDGPYPLMARRGGQCTARHATDSPAH